MTGECPFRDNRSVASPGPSLPAEKWGPDEGSPQKGESLGTLLSWSSSLRLAPHPSIRLAPRPHQGEAVRGGHCLYPQTRDLRPDRLPVIASVHLEPGIGGSWPTCPLFSAARLLWLRSTGTGQGGVLLAKNAPYSSWPQCLGGGFGSRANARWQGAEPALANLCWQGSKAKPMFPPPG